MKVYSTPTEIPAPEWKPGVDYAVHQAAENTFLDDLRVWCQARSAAPYSGKIVNFPMGDGYARYMVLDEGRSMSLIHLPLGDAYGLPEAHARGLRKADIAKMVDAQERMSALFAA